MYFFLILLGTMSMYSQESLRNYSLEEVVPSLTTLKAGFKYADELKFKNKYLYNVSNENHTFIANTISSDTIIKRLGRENIYDINTMDKFSDEIPTPVIKNLNIYADTLVIKNNMWLPSCNVTINVRVLLADKEYTLKTTPLPWRKATKIELVRPEDENPRDGQKAGNIDLCTKTNSKIILDARGSNGEWNYSPKIKMNWPKVFPESIEVYRCHASGDEKDPSKRFNLGENQKIVGVYWFNFDQGLNIFRDVQDCSSGQCIDKKMYFKMDDDSYEFIDTEEGKRLTFNEPKISKGGEGGSVLVANSVNLTILNEGGESGKLLSRSLDKDIEVNYTLKDKAVTGIKVKSSNVYKLFEGETFSSPFKVSIVNFEEYESFEYPTLDEKNRFEQKYGTIIYPLGNSGVKKDIYKSYIPHLDYLNFTADYLEYKFKNYNQLSLSQQKRIEKELETLVADFDNYLNASTNNDLTTTRRKIGIQSQINKIQKLKGLDYDLFGNPEGYRPLLSLESSMELLKNNLDTDLYLYVISDAEFQKQNKADDFIKKLPEIQKKLLATYEELNKNLLKNNTQFNEIQVDSKECSDDLAILKEKIQEEENRLYDIAKADQEKRKMYAVGIKTLAFGTVIVATASGQPAVGVAGYSILNSISDGVEKDENIKGIGGKIFAEFDKEGTLNAYKEGKLLKTEIKEREKLIKKVDALIDKNVLESIEKDKNFDFEDNFNKLSELTESRSNDKWKKLAINSKQITDYLKYVSKWSVSLELVNKKLDELKNKSPELHSLAILTQIQVEKQSKLYEKLTENLNEKVTLLSELAKTGEAIFSMNELASNKSKIYEPFLQLQFENIKENSLERIKWYEYQLCKAYEYTTLEKYDLKTTNFNTLLLNYKQTKNELKNVNDIVASLKISYLSNLQNIKDKIIRFATTTHIQDGANEKDALGRKFVLSNQNQSNMLNDLNTKNKVSIDLQADLDDEIIKPTQSNVRIKSLDIGTIELDRILNDGERIEIIATLDDKSILRKGDNFYKIDDNNDNNTEEILKTRWEWTIEGSGKENKITNKSEPSEIYKNLINKALGVADGNSGELFTLHPAWTKMHLEIKRYGHKNVVDINKIAFNIRCDYQQSEERNKKIVDIKLNQAIDGALIEIKINNKTEVLNTNFYGFENKNENIELEVKSPTTIDNKGKKFSHWSIFPREAILNQDDIKNKKIKVRIIDNLRIRPVFEFTKEIN